MLSCHRPSKTSTIDEEYQSEVCLDPGGSSCENEDPDKIANELKQVFQKIQERDNRYVIDPTKHMPELEECSFAPRVIKRKREE